MEVLKDDLVSDFFTDQSTGVATTRSSGMTDCWRIYSRTTVLSKLGMGQDPGGIGYCPTALVKFVAFVQMDTRCRKLAWEKVSKNVKGELE